jgi:hypothetical protein
MLHIVVVCFLQVVLDVQVSIVFELVTGFELKGIFSYHEHVLFSWTWICTLAGTEVKEFIVMIQDHVKSTLIHD